MKRLSPQRHWGTEKEEQGKGFFTTENTEVTEGCFLMKFRQQILCGLRELCGPDPFVLRPTAQILLRGVYS